MDPFEETLHRKAELQQGRLHLVQNELALACIFLDVAEVAQQPETRKRNIENARNACQVVIHLLAGRFECTGKQRADFEDELAKLIARLKARSSGGRS